MATWNGEVDAEREILIQKVKVHFSCLKIELLIKYKNLVC